jgi:hypothetical protein
MVYAELKLERKVDWSIYPTTTQYPLCIGKTAKDIPDMYTLESAANKGILGFLRKKPQGASSQGSSNKKEATPKATYVCETSNSILREPEPRMQNPPTNRAIRTVVQASIAIVEKPKFEMGTEYPIAMVDAVIEKLTYADPSPSTIPPMLPNPIHTTDTVGKDSMSVGKDGINIQPRVEVVYSVE